MRQTVVYGSDFEVCGHFALALTLVGQPIFVYSPNLKIIHATLKFTFMVIITLNCRVGESSSLQTP